MEPADEIYEEKPPELSLKAKEMLIYAKIYRFFAYATAFGGFAVSALIYNNASGGDFMIILERPAFLLNIFIPFIPSIILAIVTIRKTKKFHKQAKKDGVDIKGLRKRTDLYSHKEVKQK